MKKTLNDERDVDSLNCVFDISQLARLPAFSL